MAFVVGKSRNPIVQAAFAGLRKEQRAEKKGPKEPDTEEIAPSQAARVKRPSTSAKPTKPAAKKSKRGGRT